MRGIRWALAVAVVAACLAAPAGAVGPLEDCGVPPGAERCESWVATHAGSAGLSDAGVAIAVAPDGTIVVAGHAVDTGGTAMVIIGYEASGAQRWLTRLPLESAAAVAVAVSPGGDQAYAVAMTATGSHLAAVAVADGALRWDRPLIGTATALAADAAGVYATRHVQFAPAAYDMVTSAHAADDGEQRWERFYDGPPGGMDVPYAVGLAGGTDNPLVLVGGRSNGGGIDNRFADAVVIAYAAADGTPAWVARYDGPAGDRELGYAMAVAPDGSAAYLTAESVGIGTGYDYATVAVAAATGETLWVTRYAQPFDDRPLGVAVSPDGSTLVVTGYSYDSGNPVDRSATTVAYDAATGGQRWAARHTDVAGEAASSVAVSPDGRRVYVGGIHAGLAFGVGAGPAGAGTTYSDYVTLAYDAATGAQAWVGRHTGQAHDLALSPSGDRVYVTGAGGSPLSSASDMTTLAYAAS